MSTRARTRSQTSKSARKSSKSAPNPDSVTRKATSSSKSSSKSKKATPKRRNATKKKAKSATSKDSTSNGTTNSNSTSKPGLGRGRSGKMVCVWAISKSCERYEDYHDQVWGVPLHDDQKLFEMLMLEGFQAGLSWSTILNKEHTFRAAFDNWDATKIAKYGAKDTARLLNDPGIVRNRLKVAATIDNAKAYMKIQAGEEKGFDSFDSFIWSFAPPPHKRVIKPRIKSLMGVPVKTLAAETMSKALKKRGFRFVGPTICYAFMQAVGMVDDHIAGCWKAVQNDKN